ncbi:spore germination protein-like protein [Gottschalkia purinilytica]|uniref:Spore germination protein-like protein n=1 Tax=Gottschalkia purinilytica TaxID=1503 RepID=A0A0L0WF90_GOTPU|nr:GerMN domain-containing protein [Gottschalkia purinilytica]KNF10152.1 spore germination protein-like protein [Gottschalkia purinilytica]
MIKKIVAILLSLSLVVTVSACKKDEKSKVDNKGKNKIEKNIDKKDQNVKEDEEEKEKEITEDSNKDESKESKESKEEVKVYIPNQDASKLVEDKVVVKPKGNQTIEEAIVQKLQEKPKEKDYMQAIRDDIKVSSVKVKGDTAMVDLSSENLHGGSLEESSIINSVVLSLTQLDHIKKVQFLVDGKKQETLMGHILIDQPLTRDEILEQMPK